MNYSKIMLRYYGDKQWMCGETYDSLQWYDTTTPKPTQGELENLWNDLLKDEMREERNKLLKESDYTSLPDFPTANRQGWLDYRQHLRDFPYNWSVDVPFPEKPIL